MDNKKQESYKEVMASLTDFIKRVSKGSAQPEEVQVLPAVASTVLAHLTDCNGFSL